MNLKYIIPILLVVGILGCKKQNPIIFEDSYIITTKLNKELHVLTVFVDLKKNFHAYAAGEKVGKPVKLEIKPDNAWHAVGEALIPAGRIKKLASLGQSNVLEGKFTIKQSVKIGSGTGKAILYMQVCTDTLCDRPRAHELMLNK